MYEEIARSMPARILAFALLAGALIATIVVAATSVQAAEAPATPFPDLLPQQEPQSPADAALSEFKTSRFNGANYAETLSIGEVVDVLTVPADGTTVPTGFSLEPGTLYTIQVSGVFVWGGCDPQHCSDGGPEYLRWGDAGFVTDNHFHSTYQAGFIYLEVNGSKTSFSQYTPDHTYSAQLIGSGSPASFRIHDGLCCYADNAGALRVEIIQGTSQGAFAQGVKAFQQRTMPEEGSNPYGGASWGGDPYGDPSYSSTPDDCGSDILHCGCRLTTWSMTLDYFGFTHQFHTSPRELNNWLRTHGGYSGLLANPRKVLEYARTATPIGSLIYGRQGEDDNKLGDLLAAGLPVDLRVYSSYGEHHVLAEGRTMSEQGEDTWYINDPINQSLFYPNPTLDNGYGNSYDLMQWVSPPSGSVNLSSTTLVLASPAELLVADPGGLQTGMDPRTGISYNEIPDAFYYREAIADPTGEKGTGPFQEYKVFDLPEPLDGDYTIEVIGTGRGDYGLDVVNYDELGDPAEATVSGQIETDAVHTYLMAFSSTPGADVELRRLITVDIKPRSDENPVNCESENGAVPVAILTTDEFDAATVDHTTVTFEGALETHVDKKTGEPRRHEEDVDGDGDLDLILHFQIGETALTCDSTQGALIGQTFDGQLIEGTDLVQTIVQGGGKP